MDWTERQRRTEDNSEIPAGVIERTVVSSVWKWNACGTTMWHVWPIFGNSEEK